MFSHLIASKNCNTAKFRVGLCYCSQPHNCPVFYGGIIKLPKPKLRWLGCIENDLKSLDIKRWRKKAEDIWVGYHSEGGTV
jgi:hypothetical protein